MDKAIEQTRGAGVAFNFDQPVSKGNVLKIKTIFKKWETAGRFQLTWFQNEDFLVDFATGNDILDTIFHVIVQNEIGLLLPKRFVGICKKVAVMIGMIAWRRQGCYMPGFGLYIWKTVVIHTNEGPSTSNGRMHVPSGFLKERCL